MRIEAHNSLLKTLEEPPSRTVIILVTTNPYILLETIRSRSRLVQFGEISEDRIERYLVEHEGRPDDEARIAAALSGGSLAAALEFDAKQFREIRGQALEFVTLLLKSGSFAEASVLATRVSKEKQFFQRWIESVITLLQDIYYAGIAAERVGQRDLLENLKPMARAVTRSRLVSVMEAVERLKGELKVNVNRQVALEALFLSLTQQAGRESRLARSALQGR
jgi:DNA polymerase-3 subunit delta'